MKLLIAVKVAHGANPPQLPTQNPSQYGVTQYMMKAGDVKDGAIYCGIIEAEAAFEVES